MRHILTRFSGIAADRAERGHPSSIPSSSKPSAVTGVNNVARAAILGLLSAALYTALLLNSEALNAYAAAARHGEHIYSIIPIVIAFVFSLVHGAFTGQFWDAIGLKAKKP